MGRCPKSRHANAPEFRAAHEKYKDQGFEILSISIQESDNAVAGFIDHYGLNYPFLMDRSGQASTAYSISTTPTTYFIAPDGTIADSRAGVVSQSWLEEHIDDYLTIG